MLMECGFVGPIWQQMLGFQHMMEYWLKELGLDIIMIITAMVF